MEKSNNKEFIVDVNIAVYNHASYLRETIDSILAQQTSFPYRVLIGDDCSTDGSIEILTEYEKKYSDRIEVIYQPQNLGFHSSTTNGLTLLNNSKAKYIALCDGDDYWVDPFKLQKQVDFLEQNPEYVACCSNAFERIREENTRLNTIKETLSFEDFVYGNPVYTCTVLYKNIISIPPWFSECKMGDWIIWLLLARKGLMYCFKEEMGVYRVHNTGMWRAKGTEQNLKDVIFTYDVLIKNFDPEFTRQLRKGAKRQHNELLNFLSANRSIKIFNWTLKTFVKYYDVRQVRYLFSYAKNLISGRAKPVEQQ